MMLISLLVPQHLCLPVVLSAPARMLQISTIVLRCQPVFAKTSLVQKVKRFIELRNAGVLMVRARSLSRCSIHRNPQFLKPRVCLCSSTGDVHHTLHLGTCTCAHPRSYTVVAVRCTKCHSGRLPRPCHSIGGTAWLEHVAVCLGVHLESWYSDRK
jgi:hypothetical protein